MTDALVTILFCCFMIGGVLPIIIALQDISSNLRILRKGVDETNEILKKKVF